MPDLPEGSDHGQDQWIASQFPPEFKGYAVELGAYDGIHLSNTLKLERQGWEVLCIEPNPRWLPSLIANRAKVVACACDETAGLVAMREHPEVPGFTRMSFHPEGTPTAVFTLDTVLTTHAFPRLDVLCLDVDGAELRILKGARLEWWKPKAIVVERHFGEDPEPYLIEHGYRLDRQLDVDLCFLRNE